MSDQVTFTPQTAADAESLLTVWSAGAYEHIDPEKHICFVHIPFRSVSSIYQVDVCHLDPYKTRLFLFYSLDLSICRLDILGAVEVEHVILAHGIVDFTRDFSIHCNPHAIVATMDEVVLSSEAFFIPIVDLPRTECCLPEMAANVSFESCMNRINVYLGKKDTILKPHIGEFLFTGAVVDAITQLGESEVAVSFQKARLAIELQVYRSAFEPYWHSEHKMLALLMENGLSKYMQDIMLVDATLLDRRCFYIRHSFTLPPPSLVFRALVEDVPEHLSQSLPLYERGLVHLTYFDLFHWVWHCVETEQMQMQTRAGSVDNLRVYDERIMSEARRVLAQPKQVFHRRGVGTTSKSFDGVAKSVTNDTLLQIVPACFEKAMNQKRFMKNGERWPWLLTMREAGVSKESAVAWLEYQNSKYPQGGKSLKARFDYDQTWTYKKGDSCKCGNLIRNALKKKEDSIQCPFVDTTPKAAIDMEDMFLDTVKKKCMEARNDWRGFGGPAHIIQHNL